MSRCLLTMAVIALLAGCPGNGNGNGEDLLGDVVRLDDASDEVLAVIADEVDRNGTTVGDLSAQLNTPADGAAFPAGTAATIEWTLPPTTSASGPWWHGIDTGTFVWIRLDGDGMTETIDIVALTSETYTISATRWTAMTTAGGPFTATIITTVVDRGVIVSGPFQPEVNADAGFTIQ